MILGLLGSVWAQEAALAAPGVRVDHLDLRVGLGVERIGHEADGISDLRPVSSATLALVPFAWRVRPVLVLHGARQWVHDERYTWRMEGRGGVRVPLEDTVDLDLTAAYAFDYIALPDTSNSAFWARPGLVVSPSWSPAHSRLLIAMDARLMLQYTPPRPDGETVDELVRKAVYQSFHPGGTGLQLSIGLRI